MQRLVPTVCLLAAAVTGHSQTFEVASVKISQLYQKGGEGSRRQNVDTSPGSLTMRNYSLIEAIIWAYKVSPLQVKQAPGLEAERYDIQAKAAGPAKVDEMRVMLQALLAERLKLELHRETKEMTAYALLEAKGGHKMKESDADDGPGVVPMTQKMGLSGRKTTLDQLAMFLSMPLRTPVVDMTGLKGKYDFDFDISAQVPMDKERVQGEPPPDPATVLYNLLPKQLGLRLESRKLPIEMLIIDRFEKTPVEN